MALFLCGAGADAQIGALNGIRLQIVEGDGFSHAPGSASYRGLTVRVTQPSGDPLANVPVTFRLPEAGPSGTFPNGTRAEQIATDAKGMAAVWGIRWGETPGQCNVSVTAQYGPASAGTVARVHIGSASGARVSVDPSFEVPLAATPAVQAEPAPEAPQKVEEPAEARPVATARVHKPGVVLTRTTDRMERLPNPWVKRALIVLGIAGGAGGLTAYKMLTRQPPATAPIVPGPVPSPLTLSTPIITIGKP